MNVVGTKGGKLTPAAERGSAYKSMNRLCDLRGRANRNYRISHLLAFDVLDFRLSRAMDDECPTTLLV